MKVIHSSKNGFREITEMVTEISWGGDLEQVARSFSVSLIFNEMISNNGIENGDGLKIMSSEGKSIISGVIFSKEYDRVSRTVTLSAYDSLIYLLKNITTRKVEGVSVSNLIRSICTDYGVKVVELPNIDTRLTDVYRDMSIFDMIKKSLEEDAKLSGAKWICRADGNAIRVETLGSSTRKIKVSFDSNEMGLSVKNSIEDLSTVIVIRGKNDSILAQAENTSAKKKYGQMIFQETSEDYTKSQAQLRANSILDELSKETVEVQLECVGHPELVSGDKVHLVDDLFRIDEEYIVMQDSHTFSGNQHTMSLCLKKV